MQRKKQIVINFLEKCNTYSQDQILILERSDKAHESNKKIEKWQSYIEFNKHAIHELKSTKLDSWFKEKV